MNPTPPSKKVLIVDDGHSGLVPAAVRQVLVENLEALERQRNENPKFEHTRMLFTNDGKTMPAISKKLGLAADLNDGSTKKQMTTNLYAAFKKDFPHATRRELRAMARANANGLAKAAKNGTSPTKS